jgi:hypothetical protein
MKKGKIFRLMVVLFCLSWASYAPGYSIKPFRKTPPKPKIVKSQAFYHDTVFIIWVDMTGDGKCNFAYLLEKKDNYIVVNPMPCQKADECAMIMEPKV